MFMVSAPEKITAMRAALKSGDLKKLTDQAHSLKSSAANLGAQGMRACCQELEKLQSFEAVDSITPVMAQLEQEFARVKVELEQIAKTSG